MDNMDKREDLEQEAYKQEGLVDELDQVSANDERVSASVVSGTTGLNNVNEEMSTELATGNAGVFGEGNVEERASRSEVNDRGNALGWVALVFAGASWFIWPVLLGLTAAVLGFVAYKEGARGLGGWSMAIGLFALVLNLILVPFYYAIT